MQEYTRLLIESLRACGDCSLTVVGYGGGRGGLPFFFLWAAVRSLVFRGDQVHLSDAALSPLLPLLRVLRPRLRRSVTVYGLDLTYRSRFYQRLLHSTLPYAQRVVAISRATAKEAERRGVDASSIVVIPCGVRCSAPPVRYTLSPGIRLLILGRQIRRKGTVWFLRDVFPRLLRNFPSLCLTIAGEGPELPAIRKQISRITPASAVTVPGRVSEEEKRRLFLSSTIFLMPNIPVPGDMEGFGLVCIEAGNHGLPVVAAEIEGVADAVLNGETGLFFRAGDPESAVDVISQALRRPWDSRAVQQACVQRFSIRQVASRYVYDVFR